MEQTELEKKAEENYTRIYLNGDVSLDTEEKYFAYTKGYCKGYKDGQPQWHDLRKNPDDLPKAECLIVTRYHNGTYSPVHFYLGGKFSDDIIAWCELPKFKE